MLFPYARDALPGFVARHGKQEEVRRWLDAVAIEHGSICSDQVIVETLQGWIDQDRKHTALKALQGMIWEAGYRDAEFTAPLYADVAPALRQWHDSGLQLYVYSSGSVPAQKLFFGHSEAGDLTALFSGWFDTEVGGKRDAGSYQAIAGRIGLDASQILFLSDVVEELDAARTAGMRTVLVDRREDYPQPREGAAAHGHPRVVSFADLLLPA